MYPANGIRGLVTCCTARRWYRVRVLVFRRVIPAVDGPELHATGCLTIGL